MPTLTDDPARQALANDLGDALSAPFRRLEERIAQLERQAAADRIRHAAELAALKAELGLTHER